MPQLDKVGRTSARPDIKGLGALRTMMQFYKDPVACFEALYARFGDTFHMQMPTRPSPGAADVFLLVGSKYNRALLMNTRSFRPTGLWPAPGPEGSALQNLRRNPLCMHGEEHDRYLNGVAEAVNRTKVAQYVEPARAIIDEEIGRWPVDETVNFSALSRRLAQRLSFETLFGAVDAADGAGIARQIEEFHQRTWMTSVMAFPVDAPGTDYRKLLRSAERLQQAAIDWMDAPATCPAHGAFRTTIRRSAPSPQQAAANLSALAVASYETSSGTLDWALFLLSQHPEALARLEAEIDALDVGEAEAVLNAPYLDGILKETLRLVPPGPALGFRVIEACSVVDVELAVGATVYISPHLTHMTDSIYTQPRRFLPERWQNIRPNAYEYLPFSAGPRRCPGMWFALNNLKLALARFVSSYRARPAPGRRIDRAFAAITIPKGGLHMQISRRSGALQPAPCRGNIFQFIEVTNTAGAH